MATKKKNVTLDLKTLKALLNEASKNYKYTNKEFEKTDSTEAMHEAENWESAMNWLTEKIDQIKKV